MLNHHASDYPHDRLALLSYTQDSVIRTFLGLRGAAAYEQNLATLATKIYDPLPTAHYYYVAGQSHTFLGSPEKTTAQGVSLPSWLAAHLANLLFLGLGALLLARVGRRP